MADDELGLTWHLLTSWMTTLQFSARGCSIGAWRRTHKLGRRVEVHVRSDEGRNLRLCISVDEEVVMAARVPRTRSGSQESEAACVSVPGAVVRAWRCVLLPLEVGFLGFGCDMPWSMYVLLASSCEGLMCLYLIGRGTDCLGLKIWTQ